MKENLQNFRKKIDEVDNKILQLIAERFKITQKVGKYKKKYSLPPTDKKREKELFKNIDLLAKKLNLDRDMVKEIFQTIIKTVKNNHTKIGCSQSKEEINNILTNNHQTRKNKKI